MEESFQELGTRADVRCCFGALISLFIDLGGGDTGAGVNNSLSGNSTLATSDFSIVSARGKLPKLTTNGGLLSNSLCYGTDLLHHLDNSSQDLFLQLRVMARQLVEGITHRGGSQAFILERADVSWRDEDVEELVQCIRQLEQLHAVLVEADGSKSCGDVANGLTNRQDTAHCWVSYFSVNDLDWLGLEADLGLEVCRHLVGQGGLGDSFQDSLGETCLGDDLVAGRFVVNEVADCIDSTRPDV